MSADFRTMAEGVDVMLVQLREAVRLLPEMSHDRERFRDDVMELVSTADRALRHVLDLEHAEALQEVAELRDELLEWLRQ